MESANYAGLDFDPIQLSPVLPSLTKVLLTPSNSRDYPTVCMSYLDHATLVTEHGDKRQTELRLNTLPYNLSASSLHFRCLQSRPRQLHRQIIMLSPNKPPEAPTELPAWAQNCIPARWAYFCYSNGMKLWGLSDSEMPSLGNGPPIWAYLEPKALDCYYIWKLNQWLYGKAKLDTDEDRGLAVQGESHIEARAFGRRPSSSQGESVIERRQSGTDKDGATCSEKKIVSAREGW